MALAWPGTSPGPALLRGIAGRARVVVAGGRVPIRCRRGFEAPVIPGPRDAIESRRSQ
jgi:hypothetical protein